MSLNESLNHKVDAIDSDAPPRDARITRSRIALRTGLLSLLEEQKTLEQITVREITDRAGIGYATFHRRYRDKEALLHDLAAHEIRKLLAMTLPIFYSSDTLGSNRALCAYVWEHRRLWTALLTGGAASVLKEEYLNQALKVVEGSSEPARWLPDDLAVTFAVTAIVEILAWWLKQRDPLPVTKMAQILERLTIEPIFSKTELGE